MVPRISTTKETETSRLYAQADQIIVKKFSPPSVLVNSDRQVLQFRGQTGKFLEQAHGAPTTDVLRLAREDLQMELRTLLRKASRTLKAARKDNILVRDADLGREVSIEIVPIPSENQVHYFLILFIETEPEPKGKLPPKFKRTNASRSSLKDQRLIENLREQLMANKDYLHTNLQDLEAANEELQAANEEVLSSNEELQSINEELETAKEELQSTNEELITVNEELSSRNQQMGELNNDLKNLLSSVNLPIIMVDNDLRIKRFTTMAEKLLNVIPSDIGRPITNIKPNFALENLEQLIIDTIDTMVTKELEIIDQNSKRYSLRIRPYRTLENKIDGAVLVFVDRD